MNDTDKRYCSILFDVLKEKGVKDVVCSPGSRNAPLLIAAAARDDMRKHVVVDERAAAFMALGMAAVSKTPVALVCTSGTALLNYAPAVAEAFYQSVPLIVLSADRPEQWIDQDDSQTLRQFEALGNFVKRSYQLPALGDENAEMQWYANRIANDAMIEATSHRCGPVHINVQLGDPLSRKREYQPVKPRIIEMIQSDLPANKEVIRKLAEKVASSRVMFVAGFMQPDEQMNRAANEFVRMPNVVAMTETLSNLHLQTQTCQPQTQTCQIQTQTCQPQTQNCQPRLSYFSAEASAIDSVLTAFPEEELDKMAPDLVISVGGSLVSRKLKEYLRRNKHRCEHWALGWNHTTSDCFMSLTARIEASPSRVLHQLAVVAGKMLRTSAAKRDEGNRAAKRDERGRTGLVCDERAVEVPDYGEQWNRLKREALRVKSEFVHTAPWSELKAFSRIFSELPSGYNLFLSNGTAVRYAQILGSSLPHASYCNRGVSGIDGSGSTAVGGAKAYKGATLLITGDLSMAYDIAMFGLPDIPERMRVIVMDNSGGGIFRFIPSTSALEEREEYFCVPPRLPLRQLAEGYGWEYAEVHDEESLEAMLPGFFAGPDSAGNMAGSGSSGNMAGSGRKILRIICDGELSAGILKEYMNVSCNR